MAAAALLASGCYGPFHLTRKLHTWNGQVGDKWVNEAMFIVLAWVPVYGLAILGDALIFNSIEFWGGKNPVAVSGIPQTIRVAQGGAEAVLTRRDASEGGQIVVEQFLHGQPAGSLQIQQQGDLAVARDADGRVLFTAQTLPDGGILISDGDGRRVAFYPPGQVERLAQATRR